MVAAARPTGVVAPRASVVGAVDAAAGVVAVAENHALPAPALINRKAQTRNGNPIRPVLPARPAARRSKAARQVSRVHQDRGSQDAAAIAHASPAVVTVSASVPTIAGRAMIRTPGQADQLRARSPGNDPVNLPPPVNSVHAAIVPRAPSGARSKETISETIHGVTRAQLSRPASAPISRPNSDGKDVHAPSAGQKPPATAAARIHATRRAAAREPRRRKTRAPIARARAPAPSDATGPIHAIAAAPVDRAPASPSLSTFPRPAHRSPRPPSVGVTIRTCRRPRSSR